MKTILFFFALLAGITASATVTVTPLSTDYANKKVTFSVSWTGTVVNDRVWVWVDLCPVAGASPGTFAKAVISAAAAASGSIDAASLNGRGFYVTTNPSTVSATLSNATGKFSWCVYGSDAPPNVTANNGTYTLYGTPPFTLTAAGGTATQTVAATAIAISDVTITPVTLTDQTGCPGGFCVYYGSDLFIDGTHLCQQRATGAQNWEAWIKDTRDDELYRIVFMPDNHWWLAQNVRHEGTGSSITVSGCSPETCGRYYTSSQFNGSYGGTSGYGENIQGVCPGGWVLPVSSTWQTLCTALGSTASDVIQEIRAEKSTCSPIRNWYGWANVMPLAYNNLLTGEHWRSNKLYHAFRIDHKSNLGLACNVYEILDMESIYGAMPITVRCYRQL